MLVVVYPLKEDAYLPLLGIHLADLTAALRQALADRSIETLDLTPAFRRRAAAGEALFFRWDSHPNRQGHALIEREVMTWLEEHGARHGLSVRAPRTRALVPVMFTAGKGPPSRLP